MSTIRRLHYSDVRDLSHLSGLVAAYSGIRNPDGTLKDISGHGHKGTIYGALDTKGLRGRALQFSGDDYVSIADDPNFTFLSAKSIYLRCKFNSVAPTVAIISKDSFPGTNTNREWVLGFYTEAKLRFFLKGDLSSGIQIGRETDAIIEIGIWYDIVVIYDGGLTAASIKIYVNTEQVDTTDTNSGGMLPVVGGTAPVRIAAAGDDHGNNANMIMDECRFYNKELSLAEIEAEYNKGASLVAFSFNAKDEQLGSLPPKGWTSENGNIIIADDADGRYVGASGGDDILTCKGVDLNNLKNKGQIKELISDSTNLVFQDNSLILRLDDGDKFRRLTVINDKPSFSQGDPVSSFHSTWKTDNTGTSNDNQITLPLVSSGAIDFTVYWGDGTYDIITAWNDAAKTHTYPAAGTYNVKITGTLKGWKFDAGGDKLKLLEISEWGVLDISVDDAFFGCANLDVTATDAPIISSTSLSSTFRECSKLTSIGNADAWDVSAVTAMRNMFRITSLFNQDIGGWDVGNVVDMSYMLYFALVFNQDLSAWDINSVTEMLSMFSGANALSTANYSAMIIAWEGKPHQNNVTAHFGDATYNAGAAAARAALDPGDGWTITDGGPA